MYFLFNVSGLRMNRILDFWLIFTQNFDIFPFILAPSITAKKLESLLFSDFLKKNLNEAWNSNPIVRI